MKIFKTSKSQQNYSLNLRKKGQTLAFVPTMGYLHAGHLSLIKLAKKKADCVMVSIFVNPTQFNNSQDFKKYPLDIKRDLQLLKKLKVDAVFLPTAADMYPQDFQTSVEVSELTKPLCGQSRPGHFAGVTTVVLKLFQIVQPHIAIFGKKDYQQFRVIQQMTKDLCLPIQIIGAPLVREKDGLAMSSRNVRLSSQHRQKAVSLYQGLSKAKALTQKSSQPSLNQIRKTLLDSIPQDKNIVLDYVECLDAQTLLPLKKYKKHKTLLAVAVYFGKIRLIDNMII